MPDDESLGFDE